MLRQQNIPAKRRECKAATQHTSLLFTLLLVPRLLTWLNNSARHAVNHFIYVGPWVFVDKGFGDRAWQQNWQYISVHTVYIIYLFIYWSLRIFFPAKHFWRFAVYLLQCSSDWRSIENENTRGDDAGEEIIKHVEEVWPGASVQVDRVTVRNTLQDRSDKLVFFSHD